MGASVMRYPHQYSALIPAMRRILFGIQPSVDSSSASSTAASPVRGARSAPVRLFPDAQGFQNLLELWDNGIEQTGVGGGRMMRAPNI